MSIPVEVWALAFKYLRYIDLVEVSAVCKDFYKICCTRQSYVLKLKESNEIFFERDWLLKSYRKTIERFHDEMCWEITNYLPIEKLQVLRREIYYRLYYSILPFSVRSHFWNCCRSQYEPTICQFCTKLLIKKKRLIKRLEKDLQLIKEKIYHLFYIMV